MRWNAMALGICPWRKYRQLLQKVLICVALAASFIIIINNRNPHTDTYRAKPRAKLQHGKQNYPRMTSYHSLYPSNLSLLDLPNFQYLINNDICQNHTYLVIIIHSAPEHFDYRNTIRNTWGRSHFRGKTIKTVFLLAEVTNHTVQTALEDENVANSDIVQGSFLDSYKNLTYKHVMGLQWASTYCPNAEFILKMDDDIFVNIFRLAELLDKRFPKTERKSRLGKNLACFQMRNMPVVRDPLSKWFVTQEEYSKDMFEDYCSGWAYFASPDAAHALSNHAHQFAYFWVDDVHVTGTVAKSAGIRTIEINKWFDIETLGLTQWSRSAQDIDWKLVFAPTWGDMKLVTSAYKKALKCHTIHCPCCYKSPTQGPKFRQKVPATVMGVASLVPII